MARVASVHVLYFFLLTDSILTTFQSFHTGSEFPNERCADNSPRLRTRFLQNLISTPLALLHSYPPCPLFYVRMKLRFALQ